MSKTIEKFRNSSALIALAVNILLARMPLLDAEDQENLLILGADLADATDEERIAIEDAILEIFMSPSYSAKSMDLADEKRPEKLQEWSDYIGRKIREFRKKAKLNQKQLAKKSGLPQSHISRLEAGKHSPSRVTVQKLAQALGAKTADLYGPYKNGGE